MKRLVWMLSAALIVSPALVAQEQPLPDLAQFLREVRMHLEPDQQRQSGYVYVETRRESRLDASGRPIKESVKVLESYPGLPGEGRWERLTAEDGRPTPPDELARRDRDREKKAADYAQRFAREPDKMRAEQARDRETARREAQKVIDDALRVFDIRMLGRVWLDGQQMIKLSLTPRPDATAVTRAGKFMKNFTVQAWVSESEYEVARVDLEAIDDLSIGLGLLARVHKGTRASFTRRKVNGEAWLPATASYTASARLGLVKVMRIHSTSEFADYRKFTVGTSTAFSQLP